MQELKIFENPDFGQVRTIAIRSKKGDYSDA